MSSTVVKTTCPYCGVGCGILAQLDEEGRVSIKGDPEHPSNFGRLCSKGAALADTLSMEGRLLYPEVEGNTQSWDTTLDLIAERFRETIEKYGPESVAFYVSGQLLTEDYYLANKLMKGFIGSANIDTNSRLCMSSVVAAQKRAFGSDTVPCSYEDLERAKLVVLTGSNTAWCHPVLYQRIKQAKLDNPDMMIVVIDPRHTPTCEIADLHLAIKPGTDQILYSGLLVHLDRTGERNGLYVEHFTEGVEKALEMACSYAASIETVAEQCELPAEDVQKFFRLFARTERVVSVFSQGINQWSYGTDRVNAIINCHLLTGRIGRPGMGPFSLTGQPNAMGGREVGGLANQLTAHMSIENAAHRERVQRFWRSPVIADRQGLKAVDLFKAIGEGKIKALWIMASNPAVTLPDSLRVRKALQNCKFVVVSDCIRNTDTTAYANVLLPARTWGERDGTVTNSERRISRQRSFLPSPGDARADWWIVSQVASRMGYAKQFAYTESADIFKEFASLSGFENNGKRDFDISGLETMSYRDYDNLQPIQWPVTKDNRGGTSRLFTDGRFYTKTGKAQLIPVTQSYPAHRTDKKYPLVLNSGRIRDQWHTMTRTGKSACLSGHINEPFIEIHPSDAQQLSLHDRALVTVRSRYASVVLRVSVSEHQRPGSVFAPIHWSDQYSSNGVIDSLIAPVTDPISGQPEYKHTPVAIESFATKWHGFLISRRRLELKNATYWSKSQGRGLWRYEIAGDETPEDWTHCARTLLCQHAEKIEWIEYHDAAMNCYRATRIENGRLESCIFIGPDTKLPERDWLIKLFADDKLDDRDRIRLLTGQASNGQKDAGRIVCACFGVGINHLTDNIRKRNLTTAAAVGEVLKAGTNCGSCISEVKEIISASQSSQG